MASETPEPKEGDVLPGATIEVISPSWRQVLPVYLALLQDGNEKGKASARLELEKVCILADHLCEAVDLLFEVKVYAKALPSLEVLAQKIERFNAKLPRG